VSYCALPRETIVLHMIKDVLPLFRYIRLMSQQICLSVIFLSSVCDVVAPYPEGWTFRQYFAPPNSAGMWTVSVRILEKNQRLQPSHVNA